MNILQFLGDSLQPLAAASGLPAAHARGAADFAPLVHDAERGVQAYGRASDAYATWSFDSSVALWAVGIAGVVVFVEWLLARTGRKR
ncbi:hypothetical protein [Ramlibacter alkalitolerans]|uniref:Uncharacterized protein n=1 Tax=Ramlibacter alkalitolerans TaxID=2039631 RepID=A0ABS1JW42_9BURK|nr:hypothetical protein [Ramlibacter alkalitolerans]MBL0428417.1 hypothetical protein [Ramlibacter alkalitolerans]